MLDILRPPFEKIPDVKVAYNTGALFDVATGKYQIGQFGESILNGGMHAFTGICGVPNSFKTQIADYLFMSVLDKFDESQGSIYDTEITVSPDRKAKIAERFDNLKGDNNPVYNNRILITDKNIYYGNVWFEKLREYVKIKTDNAKKLTRSTPFLDREGKLVEILIPTPNMIDSFSKFQTEDVAAMLEDNELGDSAQNTSYMKQGASKARMISELPRMIHMANIPMILTAHVGKTIPLDPRAPPVRKLAYLKNGDTIKGVSDDYLFLPNQVWQTINTSPLQNDSTKAPEYPNGSDDTMKGDTDLTLITLMLLRSKTSRTGLVMQLIVSQEEGIQPSLSEFHFCKTNDRWGLEGNDRNYALALLPDVALSRTAVRPKFEANAKLRRAMNITSEMLQMFLLWSDVAQYQCTPAQLYHDLKQAGYDWDILLNTRGWWTFDNHKHPIPFLSTMDLLKMRKGEYHPYWLADDKKTYKPGFGPGAVAEKAIAVASKKAAPAPVKAPATLNVGGEVETLG